MAVNELAPITNEEEMLEVRRAAVAAASFQLAADHIAASRAHLAHRPDANYHDGVKQPFCAVELTLWIAIEDKPIQFRKRSEGSRNNTARFTECFHK
jgi:hypothetical protein